MSRDVTGLISWLRTFLDEVYAPINSSSAPTNILDEKSSLNGWMPSLNGDNGAIVHYSYSESNGEGVGKGFLFKNGFYNTDNWTLTFDFKHDNIRYTGITFLADLENSTPTSGNLLSSWEGSWPGGSAYATYKSGTVGYFDVTVKKIDSTHVQLISNALNRDTIVEVSWLANAKYLTLGARHNTSSSSYGPCRIKNINVKHGFSQIDRIYPIGSIYMSVNNTNPATLFGGTWEQLEDRFLLGAGTTYVNGTTGGEATHTLTVNEMPSHSHSPVKGGNFMSYGVTSGSDTSSGLQGGNLWGNETKGHSAMTSVGGDSSHNNMPPYLTVYMWKRVA